MGTTERLVVDLPSDLVATLREAVQRGDFGSESEAVSIILRVWHGDGEVQEDIEEIRAKVAAALAEADAGELVEADEVHAKLRAKIRSVAKQRG